MGGNRVNIILAVGVIALREAFSVLPKSPSLLEVTRFYWVAWRVGVETLMDTCSTIWRLYAADSSVDLVGISALSCMSITVALLKSLSRLV